jgi:hypothetical protein
MTKVALSLKNLRGFYSEIMQYLHTRNFSQKLTLLTTVFNLKIVFIYSTYLVIGHSQKYRDGVKENLLNEVNNPVITASGSANKGIPVSKNEKILLAEKEGPGTLIRGTIQFKKDWKRYQMRFLVNKTMNDRFSMLPFNSICIAKQVIDSSLNSRIYRGVPEIIMSRRIVP